MHLFTPMSACKGQPATVRRSPGSLSPSTTSSLRTAPSSLTQSQDGSSLVMFSLMLFVLFGFMGLALDLSQIYNRRTELQNIADSAALAAAKELNGTSAGISNAVTQATTVVLGNKYNYSTSISTAIWSGSSSYPGILFSKDPESVLWVSQAAAAAAPSNYLFVKVDTGLLDATVGRVNNNFIGVLSTALASSNLYGRAVAGRTAIQAIPLAICALKTAATGAYPHSSLASELLEFGFRRGVSYNLLNLNPGASTAKNYLINPIDRTSGACNSNNFSMPVVQPFTCTGTMPMTHLTTTATDVSPASTIYVQNVFPAVLINALNSRFNSYVANSAGVCNPVTAPPDSNIETFKATATSGGWFNWMTPPLPSTLTASVYQSSSSLVTKADLQLPLPAGVKVAGTDYGLLWSYAKAVKAGSPPYTAYATSDWKFLYPATTPPSANSYYVSQSTTPYYDVIHTLVPPSTGNRGGVRERRVLNVPLIDCTTAITGNCTAATVLGIGRFFMTAPAMNTTLPAAIYGEFAGAINEQTASALVRLYK